MLTVLAICTEPGHILLLIHYNIFKILLLSPNISFLYEHVPYKCFTQQLADDTLRMSFRMRLEIGLKIAETVEYITSHPELTGMVHNNLKSSNVLISRSGDVKIIGILR